MDLPVPHITSRQHRIVRAFRAAARREEDLALLDGWHLLHDAVAAQLPLVSVAMSAPPPGAREERLLQQLGEACEVVTVTTAVMNALSPVRTPSGVAALVRPHAASIVDVTAASPALVLVAVDMQDPGNAGAMIRSAEAGGATGVVLAGDSVDPWGWKALRASMGSTFRLPVARESDASAALHALRRARIALVATVPRHGTSLHALDLRRPLAFVLGGEGAGLGRALIDTSDERVTIPMSGGVESLNVAVAAALLVYEARRQRQVDG